MEEQDKSKIEKFKDILYSRKNKFSSYKRRKLKKKPENLNLKKDWDDKDNIFDQPRDDSLYVVKEENKSSIFMIIFIASLVFFVGAVSYAFFYLTLNKKDTSYRMDVSILGPNTVNSGADFKFTVKLENNTDLDFEGISINVEYPDSTIDSSSKKIIKNDVREKKSKLLSGGVLKEKYNVILSGIVGDKKDIKVSVIYNAVGFSNVISDTKLYQVGIDSAPVSLEIEYPKEVLPSKDFEIYVNVLSNTNIPLKNTLVIVTFPQSFLSKEFSLEPLFKNKSTAIFDIEDIKPGNKVNLKITGNVSGQKEEEKVFNFEVGDSDPDGEKIRTLFAKAEKEIVIKRPDLQLDVAVNGQYGGEYIAQADEKIEVRLSLRNNLENAITDLKIEAQIDGNNFIHRTLRTKNSYYDSNKKNIVWDKHTWEKLKSLDGGEMISDSFFISSKEVGDLAGYFSNPELKLDFKVTGTSFDDNNLEGKVSSEGSVLVKTATYLVIGSEIMYSEGPIENSGPVRPTVGETTTYTAVWKLSNSTNLLEDVVVKAKLPYYVKYLGNVNPKKYYVDFNEDTREVTWRLKKIEPFIGYRTPPKTVYFQIGITPSANQEGRILNLVGPKTVVATDTYIKTQISATQNKNDTTSIPGDPLAARGNGTVKAAEE